MNVGIVTDFYYPWIGGPSELVRNLARGLTARGHEVSVLAPSPDGPSSTEEEECVAIRRARSVPVPFGYNLRVVSSPFRAVRAWLDVASPDVIHVHHPFPLSAAAVLIARRRGIPLLATNHTIPECSLWGVRDTPVVYSLARFGFSRWLTYLLSRCDTVATPTHTAADLLARSGFRDSVHPISNGIDVERFSPGPDRSGLRERLGLDNRPIVLYTGRLDAEKQMNVWLQAAAEVLRAQDVQLVVGGRGADRERLKQLALALGIGDAVHFIGYLDDDEFPDLYRIADLYFITSPVELQSISTLEALASGLPVVAVRAGALPELLEEGRNGYLVPPGDPEAACAAINRMLDNRAVQGMRDRSRAIALGHDLRATLDGYERLLQRTISVKVGGVGVERTASAGG